MQFLAHRGLWYQPAERNTPEALKNALMQGFGVETDIRDLDGRLCISHDIPSYNLQPQWLDEFLEEYRRIGSKTCLALNIKADGLQAPLAELLKNYDVENYFVFDMAVPDTLGYMKSGLTTFIRYSELEPLTPLLAKAQGIWLDELTQPWVTAETWQTIHDLGLPCCWVSPELHRREYQDAWATLKTSLKQLPGLSELLMICTDVPIEASQCFKI